MTDFIQRTGSFLRGRVKKTLPKLIGVKIKVLFLFAPEKAVNECFRLFTTPRRGEIRDHQEPILESADRSKIGVGGLKLQTYTWGKGAKKVLLVHGWESNSSRWGDLKDRLVKEGYTVISLDAPGHGNSEGKHIDIPLYGKAIDQLVFLHKPNFAIGHSLGGTTLLYQYYTKPLAGVEKLVLLAPSSELTNLMKGFQTTIGLSASIMKAMEERMLRKYGYSFSDFSMPKLTRHFSIPTLLIHDRTDTVVSYKESVNLDKHWNSVELLLTEGLGHGLKSQKVYDAILNYLKKKQCKDGKGEGNSDK